MYNVIINATATKTSGALTILNSFIQYLSFIENNEIFFILITVKKNYFHNTKYLKVYEIEEQNWIHRIIWDNKGLQKFCDLNKIKPNLIISFQNTSSKMNNKKLKQIVYYHQALSLIKYKWNPLKKEELLLFLYNKFYGYFVNKNNKNTIYVVQLPYIKDLLCKKFRNIKKENVFVIRPNLPKININDFNSKSDKYKDVLLFPAIPAIYKNHKIIIDSIDLLIKTKPELKNKIKVLFTISKENEIYNYIVSKNLTNIIYCEENIPYEKLLEVYTNAKGLLFPSRIESYGLPLIEAAIFGLPIIAADLPYSRDVLLNYKNVCFCNPDDVSKWMTEIEKVVTIKNIRLPLLQNSHNTWMDFMKIVNDIIYEK